MKKGFTLSELLLSLVVVGVIAVLTVPILMTNVQNRLFATRIKNFSAEIEQLAQNELIVHRTRDLLETDFGEPTKLLADNHFSIVKICSKNKSLKNCWKTEASGTNKIRYNKINNKGSTNVLEGLTVILKNGIMFRYRISNEYGEFFVDVNGNDKPNVYGRDAFSFYVNSKGHIESYPLNNPNYTHSNRVKNCTNGASGSSSYCYSALVDNGWKMDY